MGGRALPSGRGPTTLPQTLLISPTVHPPTIRPHRRPFRHLLTRAETSDAPEPTGNGSQPPAISVPPGASAAMAKLLRSNAVPDVQVAKQLGLNEEYLQALMALPGTTSVYDLKSRLVALSQWQASLRRGVLPSPTGVEWPAEPFRSKFIDVLKRLEMPRFTRRFPKLLGSLMKQFLELVEEFEGELIEQEAEQQSKQQQQQQKQQPQRSPQQSAGSDSTEEQEQGAEGSQGGAEGDSQQDPSGEADGADEQGEGGGEEGGAKGEIKMQLEEMEGGGSSQPQDASEQQSTEDTGYADRLAEQMLKKFEDNWAPAMEALETASQAFDDVEGLMDGPEGFDSSQSVWHQSGWREVAALRRRLEELRELRELVRSLGRGGGKGPLKRAPQQVMQPRNLPGVVRSEQSPEETRGLTRSGDLSRMLPTEAHLLAAGWPRRGGTEAAERLGATLNAEKSEKREGEGEGSRACRLLFMARRAERQLMSYERTGWLENEPSRVTGRLELRPAAELGPIIVCLDTSGSMHGAREVVAKALTLECMRGAHRQGRKCYVYAFSGPGDVMELELGTDAASMSRLLSFLTMSFSGGTDVDAPLALSLERLTREEWELADILMVTDGEIPMPDDDIMRRLKMATEDLKLEVHGLLVGRNVTDPMKQLCTHLHVFKSWSAVGGDGTF
jgi:uncharacterized protein with von Willebrand factor type A (vWA) domain